MLNQRTVKFEDHDLIAIQEQAEKDGMAVSTWIRKTVLRELRQGDPVERRLAALEAEVQQLKSQLLPQPTPFVKPELAPVPPVAQHSPEVKPQGSPLIAAAKAKLQQIDARRNQL